MSSRGPRGDVRGGGGRVLADPPPVHREALTVDGRRVRRLTGLSPTRLFLIRSQRLVLPAGAAAAAAEEQSRLLTTEDAIFFPGCAAAAPSVGPSVTPPSKRSEFPGGSELLLGV